jgi:hypothetical protein
VTESEWNNLDCEHCGLPFFHHGRVVSLSSERVYTSNDGGYIIHAKYVWDACPIPLQTTFTWGEGVQLHLIFWTWERHVDSYD